MFKVKHFMDPIEPDDGQRLWIEPIGLTKDLCAWCGVDHVATELGPPVALWEWYQEHPVDYDCFRGTYHRCLARRPDPATLLVLAMIGSRTNLTLLHQGQDRQHNSATALCDFLLNLVAHCPPEM